MHRATAKPAGAKHGLDGESYRALMRHQAGAVTVIATGEAGARAGLTATAVASLSDAPPTLLVCVQHKAGAHALILERRSFSVNLLTSAQRHIAQRFAGRQGLSGEARFEGLDWIALKTGAPVLADALASLDCELVEAHSFTTHTVFIGRVIDGRHQEGALPLLYFRNDYWDLSNG
jgi:flavin reductase (DIM6/NTAB) family NADH-FMN oxidoreductase RutF